MDLLYTLFSFIIVIGIIVFVHELGHFLAARLCGMRVEVFSLGFGKPLFKFTRGETEYKVCTLPLGGYVKIAGMVDESMNDGVVIERKDDEFESKNSFQKLFVLSAGVIMNFILAITIYSILTYSQGFSEVKGTEIGGFQEDFPAINSGLAIGDKIIKIDGKDIIEWQEISKLIHSKPNQDVSLVVERSGELLQFDLKTKSTETIVDEKRTEIGLLGISPSYTNREASFGESIENGFALTYAWTKMSVLTIKMLISGEAGVNDLGGPVMIAKMSGDSAKQGLTSFLAFIAFLSINIGFLNLLPIPALDGGHMVYVISEAIMRRKISTDTKIKIQGFGMLFLFTLMIFVVFFDVKRLFG